jgi:hypothetical protein
MKRKYAATGRAFKADGDPGCHADNEASLSAVLSTSEEHFTSFTAIKCC